MTTDIRNSPSGKLKPAGGGGVTSVFGRIGAVLPVTGDYDSDQVDNLSGVSGSSVSDALDTLASDISAFNIPFKATYYVNPAFVGTQTGSQSNPFTTIAAAFAAAAALGLAGAIIRIPPSVTVTENVVFPATGGNWEIASDVGYLGSSTGARITGTVTCTVTSGLLIARLTSIILTGNLSGDSGAGTFGVLFMEEVRHNGSVTLTVSGIGAWLSAFRGVGSVAGHKMGGSNTLLVSVAGVILASNWVFEGGITEGDPTAVSAINGSQFRDCQFGTLARPPVPIGLNGLSLDVLFYDCLFYGVTTFTAGVSNYNIYVDGASLALLIYEGIILSGTGIQLKTLNANASDRRTLANNLGSTALTSGRAVDGLYEVVFDATLLVQGTTGLLQLNVIYTDMTGTLVTVPVGGTLDITAAVGTKQQGSLSFRHNGAAVPIAFSYTGIVTPGTMSVAASVALMCRT